MQNYKRINISLFVLSDNPAIHTIRLSSSPELIYVSAAAFFPLSQALVPNPEPASLHSGADHARVFCPYSVVQSAA